MTGGHASARQLAGVGRQYENLVARQAASAVVVPICFFLIFLLLFRTFNERQVRAAGLQRASRWG